MPTADLDNAVASFARILKSADAVKRFLEARLNFESDPELSRSRELLALAAESYREKQAADTLSEQDIDRIRTLQSNVNLHPLTIELLGSQQEMAELLQECNRQMTDVLGIDFAGISVSSGCC